jgi:predicted O-methyltransferase YrrM
MADTGLTHPAYGIKSFLGTFLQKSTCLPAFACLLHTLPMTILSDLPALLSDTAPGALRDGRNVRAGYTRGMELEFGQIAQACADDAMFQQAMAASHNRSIVMQRKLMNIMLIMRFSSFNPAGHIIEFGSYRGGSALYMAALARQLGLAAKVFALDTFAGMPATDEALDNHQAGDFKDSDFDGLVALRDRMGLDNLVILRGLFEDTVKLIAPEDRRFSLVHADSDIYPSMRFSLDWVKPLMVQGGFIVCDDPLTSTCIGAMQAVEESLVRAGALAEQVYPHLVYRWPVLGGGT